jgi:hypothetical protein
MKLGSINSVLVTPSFFRPAKLQKKNELTMIGCVFYGIFVKNIVKTLMSMMEFLAFTLPNNRGIPTEE